MLPTHMARRYLDWVYSRCIEYPGRLGAEGGPESYEDEEAEDEEGSQQPTASPAQASSELQEATQPSGQEVLLRRLSRAITPREIRCEAPQLRMMHPSRP